MPRPLRLFLIFIPTLLIIFIILSIFGLQLIRKSLPEIDGEIELAGIENAISIYRDNYGVPHIFADTEEEAWFAAGYVAAQDRLWQMDVARRAAHGRLAEIFGAKLLEQDKFFRVWGINRVAPGIVAKLSPESRRALSSYAAGVNKFIETHQDRLPIEFSLLDYKPEAWKMEDSIGISRLMAYYLCFSWHFEAVLGKVASQFGLPMALELFPAVPGSDPTIVGGDSVEFSPMIETFLAQATAARRWLGAPIDGLGSNSWVIAGQRSKTGRPILANDPHLGLALPSSWYEMHIAAGDLDVAGMTLPGAPGVVIGHNRAIAWGMTNGMVDDLDFYLERLNPGNKDEYWDGERWQQIKIHEERISVKGQIEPEEYAIRTTANGPIVGAVHPIWQNDTIAVSFRWTGHDTTDELKAVLALNRAASWQDFQRAMRHFRIPSQNVIYADSANNIGYWACGRVPVRRDGKGYLPYRGWESAGDWLGEIPFDELPHSFNPEQGFIATANNKMHRDDYPYYVSNAWEPTSRIQRIIAMLTASDTLGVDDFRKMQMDVVSQHAKSILPKMLALLRQYQDGGNELTEEEQNAISLLAEWNGDESEKSVAATIFNVWTLEFLESIIFDELGETLYNSYCQWTTLATRAIEYFAAHPDSPWFDRRDTQEIETAADIAALSFGAAMRYLNGRFGNLMGEWRWGEIHQLTLEHIIGRQKPLDHVFNHGPFPVPGSPNTVAKASYRILEPYAVAVGPSMRMIVDLAKPETGHFIIAGGQSGQPFSPHYKDQVKRWRQGRDRMVPMDRNKLARTCENILLLKPAQAE